MAGILETQGLVKTYRGVRAVDDVTLSVQKGEIYGFLGPNGAGKTTTLRMLMGLARPDAGSVRVRGVDPLADPAAAHAGLGFLPETLSFYKTLSGRQTLRFFAEIKGLRPEAADEALALVGLADAANKRVGEYSRGMTQRVGLAQALMGEPEILVLDEPTGGLDPLAHRQVKDLLRDRNRRGVTIIFSSHILTEVQELANRVGMMRKGKLVAQDTVDGLRARVGLKGMLVLTLLNPTPMVAVAVQKMQGVESATLVGDKLQVVCDAALRFDVAKLCEETGARVLNMETKEASLEDVFVSIAQGAL
ncbi:MAG: type transport system ATP-binding protein [Thermoplasmata archaeon]|nr:type transport system ATP-binding protein [Thermoplasmata archaeon]